MKKYLSLQFKLAAKQFPFVLTVTLVLLVGVGILFYGIITMFYNDNTAKQYTVGITGDTDNTYMQWGFAALQSIEDDYFSVTLAEMTEEDAQRKLEKGEIAAYVIIPEGFMDKALTGDMTPVTYVTSAGLEGIAELLKKEVTYIVTDLVVQSQKGAFGMEAALRDNGIKKGIYDHMTNLSLQYTDMIFHRGQLFVVESLGVSDNLAAQDYYLCALTVILLALSGIPYAAIYIRRDHALSRLLLSRGYPVGKQLLCEYIIHLLSMLALTTVVLLIGGAMVNSLLIPTPGTSPKMGMFLLLVVPVIVMLAALNMLIFNFCDNLVSGLLLHVFVALSLCYMSGCFYPVYVFPKAIWTLASWLPNGLARSHLATAFSQSDSWQSLAGLLGYGVVFYGLAHLVRIRKTAVSRG